MAANDREAVRSALRSFITTEVAFGRSDFADETDLVKAGIIDSMSLARLMGFIEDELGLEVDGDDLVPENFRSVRAMIDFVERARQKG